MNCHNRCPACESGGRKLDAQGQTVFACTENGCRVFTYGRYFG